MCPLQLVDGRRRLLAVQTLSPQADLSILRRTVVSCQQTFIACCLLHYVLPGTVHRVLHHHFSSNDSWLQKLDHSCQGRSFSANDGQKLRNFKLFWRLYVYNPERGTFDPVPAMPLHLPRQIRRALESLRFINTAGNCNCQTCSYSASGLCTLCFCCIAQRLDALPRRCMMQLTATDHHVLHEQTDGYLKVPERPILQCQQY